jgi:predicted polyphosphate/ATP-dependent NAD kinase
MAGQRAARRVGLVVNPVAGMGGRVALKGTDGRDTLLLARQRGATPVAPQRARRALERLRSDDVDLELLVAPGIMGADIARAAGLAHEAIGAPPAPGRETTPADTRNAAAAMRERGVDLLLFAGGDGTARDIHDTIGDALPLVGVPTGVKMHSGVFASSPEAAGAAAVAYLRAPGPQALRVAEIADVDEDAVRADRIATRLHGAARVPRQPALMVAAKAASAGRADQEVEAVLHELAATTPPGHLLLVGPGTTAAGLLRSLDLEGTLLGVDAVQDGRLVGRDLDEAGLLALLDLYPREHVTLVSGVVGGQGSLLGRGNQQLSAAVLRRLGADRLFVVAAADKLLALNPATLRVDTGDAALDAELSGYVRVHVAPRKTILMKVST